MAKIVIFMAPSEAKSQGGSLEALNQESFIFPKLYHFREAVAKRYNEMMLSDDNALKSELTGLKKQSDIRAFEIDIFKTPTKKAIERYSGVAFEYLGYESLSPKAQAYVDRHTLIFSNLFGPVSAQDALPYYKFKQNSKTLGQALDAYYKEHFSEALDSWCEGAFIVDLRAGVYEKFYTIKKPYVTFKFLKNGKVVSHYAKAYRGKLLALMARGQIQSIEALLSALPKDMKLLSCEQKKLKTLYTIEIIP